MKNNRRRSIRGPRACARVSRYQLAVAPRQGRRANSDIQHTVPGRHGTTIFPWSHRPTRCPGGCVRRCAARFTKTNDGRYLKPYNERNHDENGFWNGFWNDARFSAACGL
jgi:hypothetical protein